MQTERWSLDSLKSSWSRQHLNWGWGCGGTQYLNFFTVLFPPNITSWSLFPPPPVQRYFLRWLTWLFRYLEISSCWQWELLLGRSERPWVYGRVFPRCRSFPACTLLFTLKVEDRLDFHSQNAPAQRVPPEEFWESKSRLLKSRQG